MRNTARQQPAGTWDLAGAVLAGYQRHRPLTPQEADVLGDLIIGRLALTLAISQRRAAAHEDNQTYIGQYDTSTPSGGFWPASMLTCALSPVGFSTWRYVTIVAPVMR